MLLAALVWVSCQSGQQATDMSDLPDPKDYDAYPVYEGNDLGVSYTPDRTTIKVWSPAVKMVELRLYDQPLGGEPKETIQMQREAFGVWVSLLEGDRKGTFYTVRTQRQDGSWGKEKPDPYATAVGTNGERGCIVDLDATDPDGWVNDRRPPFAHPSQAVIYELHVRDLSSHPGSGITNRGKFLGLTETGTTLEDADNPLSGKIPTGLDHILSLGVTHIHLLPSFDYASVDESQLDKPQFNWGYDPKNYNAPEGSYSTDPANASVRIREFKQMVQTLHSKGLRVVMDVVYNHTFSGEDSPLNQTVPGYYYRHAPDGNFSDASACGNETASERPMMRRFMIQSLKHWVEEYHVDGFRFDLMAIHDIETMNQISRELHEVAPSILLYGEGWTAGASPLPEAQQALKKYTHRLDRIAAFSDDMRDGIKGTWSNVEDRGFASGDTSADKRERVKYGIAGGIAHPQIDHRLTPYLPEPWAAQPTQTINYVACHDNHTLWDRFLGSNPDDSEADRIRMHLLSNTIVMTSQGIPFLHAGTEFLRTKHGEENSYNLPDSINWLDWTRRAKYDGIVRFYRQLIQLRKDHPAFRMENADLVRDNLAFLPTDSPHLIAYRLNGDAVGDTWSEIIVVLHGGRSAATYQVPDGQWQVVLEGDQINQESIRPHSGTLQLPPTTAVIMVR